MRETLIKHGGYDAECVKAITYNEQSKFNVSAGTLQVELRNLLAQVEPDDSILFAFSGHGDVDSDGKAWLMPPDAKPGDAKLLKYTAIPVSEIYELLGATEARQRLIILDACHAGASRGDAAATKLSLSDIEPGKGFVELLSCDSDQLSYENKELGNGVFSHFLIKGLAGDADIAGNGDTAITIDELFDYAYLNTTEFVEDRYRKKQTPMKRMEVSGEFVVAVRTDLTKELEDDELIVMLKQLADEKRVRPEFVKHAVRWLAADEAYPPRFKHCGTCLLYTSPSPRDQRGSRMPSSA